MFRSGTRQKHGSARPVIGEPFGRLYDDAVAVVMRGSVLDAVIDYSESEPTRELGGFLVGRHEPNGRPRVVVNHFLPAVDAQSAAASLTFTHETWSAANRQVEQQYPDQKIVGWHHTHPNFGIFLSGYDLFIHRNFFPHPWQIALVVDPQRQELGFYQWRGSEVADCGFVYVPDYKE